MIEQTCDKHGIARGHPTLHSDRGSPMRATTTAELLVDLGAGASFSRPRVSNDNPFSEAQFKTLKYRPEFPSRFEGIEHACARLRRFFTGYNDEHRHSGIGFMTPAAVHFGRSGAIDEQRRRTLHAAYAAHPERFKGRVPTPPPLPQRHMVDNGRPVKLSIHRHLCQKLGMPFARRQLQQDNRIKYITTQENVT